MKNRIISMFLFLLMLALPVMGKEAISLCSPGNGGGRGQHAEEAALMLFDQAQGIRLRAGKETGLILLLLVFKQRQAQPGIFKLLP